MAQQGCFCLKNGKAYRAYVVAMAFHGHGFWPRTTVPANADGKEALG